MRPDESPGLVCAHHHLYSSLARGMPAPPVAPTSFIEILQQVWWRLDIALDAELIGASALLGALEALESGCTTIVDHHESPSCIEGSLTVIAEACETVGVRYVGCYGVTDRHGPDGARRGLEENDRFLAGGGRGMVGVHATFTCSDETLSAAADLAARHRVGVHIHVAEGPDDADAHLRLAGLTADDWLLVHGVGLPDHHGLSGTIVHNPRSNMGNGVGYARPARFNNPVALGTDGIGAAMFDEFRVAYARLREDDVTASPDTVWDWLATGWSIVPEAGDDRVRWNYQPIDPWHLAFTTDLRALEVTIDGETVLADGRATRVDGDEIRAHGREAAAKLFARL